MLVAVIKAAALSSLAIVAADAAADAACSVDADASSAAVTATAAVLQQKPKVFNKEMAQNQKC